MQYLPSKATLSLYCDVRFLYRGAPASDVDRFPLAIQHSESRRRWGVRFATPQLYQDSLKGYYRLVSGIDSAVASIRETLNERGLSENTIIVYSADHGIFNGEHGLAGKWYAHEESIRIPLIIYDPRLPEASRAKRKTAMTLNIDLHPTLLEMAGLEPAGAVQGRSLLGLVRGDQYASRPAFYVEHHFPFGGWIPSSEGIRTEKWKYIHYTDFAAPYEELYNLVSDPFETQNLIGDREFLRQQQTLTACTKVWHESLGNTRNGWKEPVSSEILRNGELI